MYDNNPTLENIGKKIDPKLQGQVIEGFDNQAFEKRFYIEIRLMGILFAKNIFGYDLT